MFKDNKKNHFIYKLILALTCALVFSCTNVTTTQVVDYAKKKLAVPTADITTRNVEYGTVIKFSYSPIDSVLFYTTDGTAPEINGDSEVYDPNKGIKLTESCTITAILYHSNYENSDSIGLQYNVILPEPKILPETTDINTSTEISFTSSVVGANIYYLVDSTVELNANNGIEYDKDDGSLTLSAGHHVVKAIAVNGKSKSEVVQKIYNVADKDGVYLDSLTLSKGNIAFSRTEKEYSVNLGYADDSVTITAASGNADVTIKSELNPEINYSNEATVPLNVGMNTFFVVAKSNTDPNKTITYTLKIQRAGPDASKDATLANINITSESSSHVSLDKMFDKNTTEYKAEVDNFVTMVKISAGTSDTKALASYDKEVLLKVGENKVEIVVTAEDTSVTKTYTVMITRKDEIDDNANLKSLLVDGVSVVNVTEIMTYATKASKVKVVATAQSENITSMKINNVECTGTTVNVPSEVVISIVAADRVTTRNYTLKLVKDSDVELSGLKVDGEDVGVSKNMNVDVKDITAQLTFEVSGDVTKILVNKEDMTATKAASIQVSSSKEISNDKNVKIEVFAADGTSKTYSLDLHYKAPITDKIILHAESKWTNCYVWTGTNTELLGAWPGKAMTDEGSNWKGITLDVTSANIIFNGSSGQTDNLSREAGEWWFKDGKWTEYNPEDNEAPVLTEFISDKTGTVSGNVTLTVSATDNIGLSKAEFKADGNTLGTATMSGKSATVDFILDTENLKNGTHTITATVYDTAGLASNSEELQITPNNENPAPIASISGSISIPFGAVKTYSASNSKDKNGKVVGYKWSVSDLSYSESTTGEEITITAPNSPMSFTITLVVTDNEGKDSKPVTITVNVTEPKKSNDFREESIYFLMTARFYDGDKSNNRWCRPDDSGTTGNKASGDYPWRGDFKGLIEKLDYIKAMGFSAIWITPPVLNRSDYDFHGYHAWNMNKIDPRLESAGATYQDLIDKAHEKGIKIIQDIVLNHSCRYGLEDLFSVKYYGSKSITWERGKGIGAEYYDDYNPTFVYDGLTPEPNSRRTYYNGDLWQENAPTITWDTADDPISLWGTKNNQYDFYYFQWPKLTLFNPKYFHTGWLKNWEDETCQTGTIHEDCIDLNTENAEVQKYLIDAYTRYIEMGVDGFRIDTVKHISRNTFNRRFIPAFKEAGGENFYMFGEVCTRVNEVWNHGVAPLSTPFYTWKERTTYSDDDEKAAHEAYEYEKNQGPNNQPTSDNHALKGNNYHEPDYSKASGMHVIDFPMHWNFDNAGQAYNVRQYDHYYNDPTWNVVYVDSHDYGPNMDNRYGGGTDAWAENMTYMWTFRGIPCLYYGSEIEFQGGQPCDKGPAAPLASTGRAYYGDHIEGSVTASDFGEWTASGTVATTLDKPLPKHLADLNKIRRAVPALQKGQYSTEGCSGGMSFKRRFTKDDVDSFVLVTISGGADFKGIPGGTYVDLVTGDSKTVSEGGTLSASCSGKGNARIYVLQNQTAKDYGADKKIAGKSSFLK